MKKTRKGFLLGIFMLMMTVCMLFGACGSSSKKVKISFDTVGGPAVQSVELTIGEEYTLPVPERTGFSFEGWYDNAEYTGLAVTAITAEKKMTFYAKWEQLYAITLQLGGGSLDAGTTLYAKEGTNVYTFMQSYIPTLADHEFGEWLVGETPLDPRYTLTSAGVTLKAHYKVAYSVELYLQNLTLNGYDKAENNFVGYEYAGVTLSPTPAVKGFTIAENANSDATKMLTENASENTFRLYYNRSEIRIILNANYPMGTSASGSQNVSMTALYGTEIELPATLFTLEGYCLVGWGASALGEVEYRSSYISSLLYNGTYEADSFKVEEETILYAIWVQGYTNLFGGDDYIFHLSETAEEIYLLRGGVMFVGSYSTRTGLFLFTTPDEYGDDTLLIQGKLNDDHTFSYFDDDRNNFSYDYFKNLVGKDENYKVFLDGYNGIRFIDHTLVLNNESKGTYTIDESGFYHVTYTTGPKAGESYVYILGISNANGAIFMVRDEEEYGWGTIPRAVVYTGADHAGEPTYYTSIYGLTLNGFGNATYRNADGSATSYYYKREGDIITVMNATLMTVFEARLTTIMGTRAYWMYSSSYDVTYESLDTGATLTLDGMYQATYTENGTPVQGTYILYSSLFGTLVRFFGSEGQRLFLARTEKETVLGENEEKETIYHYYFDEKPLSYTEYYYMQDGSVFSTVIIVLNDGEEGMASVYGYTSTKTYEKILYGTYTYNEETKTYAFNTKEQNSGVELAALPFDIVSVQAFMFDIDNVVSSSGSLYPVIYFYSMTTEADGTTNYDKQYTAEDGSTLTIVRGFAIYQTAEGKIITGAWLNSDGRTYLYDTINGDAYYFELYENEDEGTRSFLYLSGVLGKLNALLENGYVSKNETLTFDGKGGVIYSVTTTIGEGQTETKTYEGTFTRTDDVTEFDYIIYKFESAELSFKFIFASLSASTVYFAKYNEEIHGEYNSEVGSLVLDGFSFLATYTEYESGVTYSGIYSLEEKDVVLLYTGRGYFYFDLKGNTFTVRDEVFGSYFLVKNQSVMATLFAFDGYGNLTVRNYEDGEWKTVGEGTYTKAEDGSYVLVYNNGVVDDVTVVGWLGTITMSSTEYNAFYLSYEEVISSYVNENDWSVLVLDNRGSACRYDAVGKVEEGSYVIITTNLLYFVNADGTDACIYTYDKAKGTAKPLDFIERAYYAEDFEAILFTRYGFMVMAGETRYYYNVVNDKVILYRQDTNNPDANDYGFVEEDFFGSFTDEKKIGEKTYYASSSFTLTFTRKEASKELYPVPVSSADDKQALEQLKFSPGGASVFYDNKASVRINGKEFNCTVVRTATEMYILLPGSFGNFRFDIDVTYRGDYDDDVNEYEITAMRTEVTLYSYTYLNYLYIYLMQGYFIDNYWGVITIGTTYTETGDPDVDFANGSFGGLSNLNDSQGNLVSFKNVEYTYANRTYSVRFQAEDGYYYNVHFVVDTTFYRYLGMYAYGLNAFTREETLTAEGGYTIFAERILMTENTQVTIGGYWSLTLSWQNGEELEELTLDTGYIVGNKIYYFVRTREEETNRITSSTLYIIELKQRVPQDVEDVVDELEPFVSATVTKRELKVAYTEDGASFVEYDEDGIVLLQHDGRTVLPETCERDEATGAYTVTSSSGKTYTVTIGEDGTATIALVE